MLLESYHHVLKGKFMDGKRGRRLDTLLFILTQHVVAHYELRYRRQMHGFEGLDLEDEERARIAKAARDIAREDIQVRLCLLLMFISI